jgi:non-specific serine/threonine protein kinase
VLVLHGIFTEAGEWEIWAEDSALSRSPAAAPRDDAGGSDRSGGSGGPQAYRHPFAVEVSALSGVLARTPVGSITAGAGRGCLPVALPSAGGRPCPSAELAAASGGAGALAPVELAAWLLPTVVLSGVSGARLLRALDGAVGLTAAGLTVAGGAVAGGAVAGGAALDDTALGDSALGDAGGEIILGATLRFAAAAARFCASLVRRGEVVPGLASDDDSDGGRAWHAFWRPLYLADASACRDRLATALPPAARAQLLGAELTGRPAAKVLEQMLTSLTDAAVRLAFAEHQYPLTVPVSLLPPRTGRGTRHPGATAWLTALTAPRGGRFRIDEETDTKELARLAERLGEWLESGGIESGPVRTCFRLIAPGEDDANDDGDRDFDDRGDAAGEPEGEWLVELLLQSARDPSLIVGAADIWRGGPGLRAISRYAADPGAELLAGLDRAGACFPDLRRALRHGMPVTLPLTTEAAHEFLRTIAPTLAQGGFGVLLPAWCSGGSQALRFGVKLKAAAGSVPQPGAVDSPARFGLGQLVDYQWRVAIGDQELTSAELAELAQLKAPLVRLRGRWVDVDARELEAAAAFVARAGRRPMTVADVVRTELFGLGPEAEGVPLAEIESSGWLGDVLSGAP